MLCFIDEAAQEALTDMPPRAEEVILLIRMEFRRHSLFIIVIPSKEILNLKIHENFLALSFCILC